MGKETQPGRLGGLAFLLAQCLLAFVLASHIPTLPFWIACSLAASGISWWCYSRYPYLFPSAILLALSIVFVRVPLKLWNPYVLPSFVFFLLALRFPKILRREEWLVKGSPTPLALKSAILAVLLSSSALVLWVILANPDLSQATAMVPKVSIPLLVLGALIFSLINAATEELIFRGVLWDALEKLVSIPAVLIIQALFFGAIHYRGFPSGWIGVCLAFIFAVLLGILRIQTKGLWIPFLVHILADLTIFSILAIRLNN